MIKPTRCLTILGATGSIGVNTLRVLAEHPERFSVYALTANRNVQLLAEQCQAFTPEFAVVADAGAAAELKVLLQQHGLQTKVEWGAQALAAVAAAAEVDTVMAAIVGGAGLLPTLAAARAGKKILLANKEALVMAGSLFMQTARQNGAALLPIDSEHNAIFQCLPIAPDGSFHHESSKGFEKIVLTASGGPFRSLPFEQFANITVEQACKHPNWSMGRKISVDSATLVNKGLELIEASYLFETAPSLIDVVIHPQSIIHSLVYYRDGSVLAQLGNPDMRTPIAYGLAWPERLAIEHKSLDLVQLAKLDFHEPDLQRFQGLLLGRQAAEAKGAAPNVFNAANEVAVAAFLAGKLGFVEIPVIIAKTLERANFPAPNSLEDVLEIDKHTRALTADLLVKAQVK